MPRTISAKYGSTMSPSSTPTMRERRVASARASADGEYCNAEAAATTRRRVLGATGYPATGFNTRETVAMDTPALRATSEMLAIGRQLLKAISGKARQDRAELSSLVHEVEPPNPSIVRGSPREGPEERALSSVLPQRLQRLVAVSHWSAPGDAALDARMT